MHRTQIYLPDDLYERLKTRSRIAGVSISELIRCPLWTNNRKHYPMDDIVLFDSI
jgi:hypothetical protein